MSSTMVSVLSPHWGGRLRRNKRGGPATSANSQEATGDPVSPSNAAHEQLLRFQTAYRGETGSMDGSQAHERSPSSGNRGNALGWSSKSGPPRLTLDYSTSRPVIQPFYVGLGELDNRDKMGSAANPEGSTTAPYSPLSFTGLHTQHGRMSQASGQGELSPARSTPTTSGMPLSLRRLSYNWRNSSQAAESSPAPPLSISDSRATESGSVISPHSSHHSETHGPNAALSSASPNSELSAYPAPSFPSKQTSLTGGLAYLKRDKECESAETTNPVVSETSVSHRLSQYERYAFLKSQALPRGTTLRSTSWWKRVTQEGSRSVRLGDTASETSAPSLATGGKSDDRSKTFRGQFPENLDDNNNNRTESVYQDNLNIASKPQGNANTVTQVNVHDTAARDPDWSRSRPTNGSNLNNKERQRTHSLPGVSLGSKISCFRAHDLCPLSLDRSKFTDPVFDGHDKYPSANSSQNTSKKDNNNSQSSPPTSPNRPQSLSSHNSVASVSQATTPHSPLAPTSRVPAVSLPQSISLFPKPNYSPVSSNHANITSPRVTTAHSDCTASAVQPRDPSPLFTPDFITRPASVTVLYGRRNSLTSPTVDSNRSPKNISHPQGGKTFTSRLIFSPEKTGPQVEGRKVIRVTWQESVDWRHSEANKVQDSEAPPATTPPLFPPRPPRSPDTPFSLLRQRQLSLASDSVGQIRRRGEDVDGPSQYSVDRGGRSAIPSHSADLSPDSKYHRRLSYSASSTGTEASRNTSVLRKTSPPPTPAQTTIPSHPDTLTNRTSPISELTSSSSDSPQIPSLPFQNETDILRERLRVAGAGADQLNNNDGKPDSGNSYKPVISTKPHLLPGADKAHNFPSACVRAVDTVSLRISNSDNVDNATPIRLTPHVSNAQVAEETEVNRGPLSAQTGVVIGHRQSCGGESCSTENRQPPTPGANPKDGDGMTDVLCQNNSLSEASRSESPKKGLFKGKKRDNVASTQKATPGPTPESERGQKGGNKMDQVLSRLRQTFRTRRFEDDLLTSWRAKRASPTHSDSSSSNGEVSRMAAMGEDVLKEDTEREALEPEKTIETEIRYVFLKKRPVLNPAQQINDVFTPKPMSESKSQASSQSHEPERHQLFYKGDRADSETAKEFVRRDLSAHWQQQPWSPGRSATLPTRARMSSASPGSSPYSPLSSLSSLSPFTPSDDTDDSVFYSPGLRKKSASGFKLGGGEYGSMASGRGRASTGTSSEGLHRQNSDRCTSYSSCADLKYGILAGRSVSVSSVLSSRPSGPGRISTGPTAGDCRMSSVPSEPGQMRSRSLPRCFARSSSNWSPEGAVPKPLNTANAKPQRTLWGAGNVATPPFAWDTEDSPSPPWSPTTRRISMPPSPSSPSSPTFPIIPQDIESIRSHLPSKGFISCLTSFEESSDSNSSDSSTTDDEYYLEPEDAEEKETEL